MKCHLVTWRPAASDSDSDRRQRGTSQIKINVQQESTTHNLLDHATLHYVQSRMMMAFAVLSMLFIAFSSRTRNFFVNALAPHVSTVPVLVLLWYTAYRFHLEAPEIVFAIFALCYARRVYTAARPASSTHE